MKSLSYDRINKSREYLSALGKIVSRALFGGYSLSVDNTVFAMVCDGELYLRASEECAAYTTKHQTPLLSFNKRGRSISLNYFLVNEQLWKEPATLLQLSAYALSDAQREKKERESIKRLRDLPNITGQLEIQLYDVQICDLETLKEYGAREAWLRVHQAHEHVGLRSLLALAGAIAGLHSAALPAETRNELLDWYHRVAKRK